MFTKLYSHFQESGGHFRNELIFEILVPLCAVGLMFTHGWQLTDQSGVLQYRKIEAREAVYDLTIAVNDVQ